VLRALTVAAVALVLAGCGSDGGDGRSSSIDPTGSPAEHELQLTVDRGDGSDPETYTLACDGADGATHPDPEAACGHLQAMDDPFARLAEDVVCTEQYGGPQTATVTGRWDGEPVDLALSRTDGCRIAQWDALGPLLPGPVG
jgi:hypothetical protein